MTHEPVVAPLLLAGIFLSATMASADTQVNCSQNPSALHPAIAAAVPGSTLQIQGTCRGTYTIDKNLKLSGKLDAAIDGNGQGPVLTIVAGVHVVLDRLVITGGASNDVVAVGGVANAGHLEVRHCRVVGNTAVGEIRSTGGIQSFPVATASLLLDQSEVADNRASGFASGSTNAVGGVRNDGPITISQTEIRNNTAFVSSGAFNRAYGGALFGPGTSRVERSIIRDNVARSEHTGTTDAGLVAGAVGAFAHSLGTDLVVQDTLIRGNRAFAVSAVSSASAGAIASGGTLAQVTTLINTEVFDNVAESGTLAVGAISNNSTTFVLDRSTFKGNTASATLASGLAVGAIGTGFLASASTTLTGSTVMDNEAYASIATGGLHRVGQDGAYQLNRTGVKRNSPVDCNFSCQP